MLKETIGFRIVAALMAVVFLVACTKTVARKPLEERHYRVDWEQMDSQKVRLPSGLEVEGVVLTPAQWPLEASLKRLAQLDFIGVFTEFDLRFSSSSLDHETLRNLFNEGYVPALVRVRNTTVKPRFFAPVQLALLADGETSLYTVPPEILPERFKQVDWMRTAGAVLMSVLFIFIILASVKEGRAPTGQFFQVGVDIASDASIESQAQEPVSSMPVSTSSQPELEKSATPPGILFGATLPPDGQAEGFVFFQLDQTVADWRTVQLVGQ